ncbi:unnamed protein product, partial [Meganyctiphanes norvegica]
QIGTLLYASHVKNFPIDTPNVRKETNTLPAYPANTVVVPAAPVDPYAPVVVTNDGNKHTPLDVQSTSTTQYHSQDELGQFTFGYSGGSSSRHETGDADGTVRGSYSYVDPNGEVQTQHYIADDDGFRVVGTNLPSTLLRNKRSIINTKFNTVPMNPLPYVPLLHVPGKTITKTSYTNGPILSQSGPITYIEEPVGSITKTSHHKVPVSAAGYLPSFQALTQHGKDLSYQKPTVLGYVPRSEALTYHVTDLSDHKVHATESVLNAKI